MPLLWAVMPESGRPPITAIMVLAGEGEEARPALIANMALARRLIVVHDGPISERTAAMCRDIADETVEYEKRGCKEPHLVRALASLKPDEWCLHVDSDEILTPDLIREVENIDWSKPYAYAADLQHIRPDGEILKYRRHGPRTSKVFLFNVAHLNGMIGLPHRGYDLNAAIHRMNSFIEHRPGHLANGFWRYLRRESGFAATEARLRRQPVWVFDAGEAREIDPASNELPWRVRMTTTYPLLALIPGTAYRTLQALRWVTTTRSWSAFSNELMRLAFWPACQIRLCAVLACTRRSDR